MGTWTAERILALAPDAGSAKSGRDLAAPRKWKTLGKSEAALWGEIQGSGAKPYQTQIDLGEPAFRCTCPSRKFPCKHALGLFLLLDSGGPFKADAPPGWVSEWLAQRASKSEKKKAAGGSGAAPVVDEAAAAKRLVEREKRVTAGVQELQRWMSDLLHQGLSGVHGKPHSFWDAPAARMVDAQAPGLARLVREMASVAASGQGWQSRLLERLARLHLLLEGWKRIASLAPDTQEDVRTLLGFTKSQDEVLARPGVRDHWVVVGQKLEVEDRLRVLSTWLWGRDSSRGALVLSFAHASQPMEASLAPGTMLDAQVAFFPGAFPMRALVKERHSPPAEVEGPQKAMNLAEALGGYAAALARNPWIERYPLLVRDVTPVREQDAWLVRDGEGRFIRLSPRTFGWDLLAVGGGRPVTLFGEFDGEHLHAFSVFAEGRFIPLRGAHEHVG